MPQDSATIQLGQRFCGGDEMSLTIIRGATNKPTSSTCLIDILSTQEGLNGKLFVTFPIIKTAQGSRTIDALLVSPDRGIVLFDLIESHSPGDFSQRQDDAANALEARLRLYPELLHRRTLMINISTLSFAPSLPSDITDDHGYVVTNRNSIARALLSIKCPEYTSKTYRLALSVLENASTIRTRSVDRSVDVHNSRGHRLKKLEESIATLDADQSAAVVETVDGIQRIRGLAGSGKTLVLALKAAYLHALHPDWMIAVTFYTPALEAHFRDYIQRFMLEQTGVAPEWRRLRILGAWGNQAPVDSNDTGIYAQYCEVSGAEYMDYSEARSTYGSIDPFEIMCRDTLLKTNDAAIDPLYDAIIVDEAQDFPPSFLRLCYRLLDSNKRLTYAYDELQFLTNQPLPAPESIFHEAPVEIGKVALQSVPNCTRKHDIILPRCYRSSRPILVTAHSIGFGIYRENSNESSTNLVQMFDNPRLWKDLGYEVKSGDLGEGQTVQLCRSEHSSPRFLEDHSRIEDIIQFLEFKDAEEQANWVVKSITKNLNEDELHPSDILVINPNPLTTRSQLGPIRARLFRMAINSHLVGVDSYREETYRKRDSSITFAGISMAKGNEAGMVYVVNAHDGLSDRHSLSIVRSRLFTAITRSKAWVRVLGIGPDMQRLVREFSQLKKADFELSFRCPTLEERERLQIVHKNTSSLRAEQIQQRRTLIDKLISDYEEGRLDEESKRRLENVVGGAG